MAKIATSPQFVGLFRAEPKGHVILAGTEALWTSIIRQFYWGLEPSFLDMGNILLP